MLPEHVLQDLVKSAESQLLERKRSCPKDHDIRKSLCAFANTVPEGQYGVFLIGVEDDGIVVGIESGLDSMQKTITDQARTKCFPPIECVPQVFSYQGKQLLAVVVPENKKKPYFTGHSYVRIGSESRAASESEHESLIASRNTKAGRLIQEIKANHYITVSWHYKGNHIAHGMIGGVGVSYAQRDYQITACDAWLVHLKDRNSGSLHALRLDQVEIEWDLGRNRFKLKIDGVP